MATNPLEELFKTRAPKYGELGSGQEAVSTNVARAGNSQVITGPYSKTNAALQFAEGLNKLPDVYNSAVKARQKDAAIKVAQMDESEFKEAYQKIIAGDAPDTASLFGYTKAHQQKIVERYHNEVVPLEVKEISRDFKNKLNDYSSIIEFDEDVDSTIDAYYADVAQRFNASPFTAEAHGLLALGKAAKLKIDLHDAYEGQALEYIKGQSIANGVKTLDDQFGNFDGDGFVKVLNGIHTESRESTGGDLVGASEITVAVVNTKIEALLAIGDTQSLAEAEELLEAAYETDVLVGGKKIFETAAAYKNEANLRAKIAGQLTRHPQRLAVEVKALTSEWQRKHTNAKTEAEREQVLQDWQASIDGLKDSTKWDMAMRAREESLTSPIFSHDRAIAEKIEDFGKLTGKGLTLTNADIMAFIQGEDFTQEEINLLTPRSDDDSGVSPTDAFMRLQNEAQGYYNVAKRDALEEVFNTEYETDDEQTTAAREAVQAVRDDTNDWVIKRTKTLIAEEMPKKEANQLVADMQSWGATPKQVKQFRTVNRVNPESALTYYNNVKDSRLTDDVTDLFREKADGSVEIKIRDWVMFSSDYVELARNFNKLRDARVFKDPKNQQEQYERVLEFINSRSGSGDESIYSDLHHGVAGGFTDMLTLIKLRGVSEEDYLTDVVSGSYTIVYPDVAPLPYGWSKTPVTTQSPFRSKERSDSYLSRILIEGDIDSTDLTKFPIALDGNINNTIEAIRADTPLAFSAIAEKLGVKPESVLEAQKAYLQTLGYFPEDDTVDNDDDPTDDDEKKSNDGGGIESAVDVQTGGGMDDLNDLEPSGAQFKIQENYPLVQLDEDKAVDTFRTTPKDFMKQYYLNNRSPSSTKAEVARAFEKKWTDMTTRDPRLLQMENKIVTLSFDMPTSRIQVGTKGVFNEDRETGDHHITISPNQEYGRMEQTVLHESIHSLQFADMDNNSQKLNYVLGQMDDALKYTSPDEDFRGYLQSPVETEARLAEVARNFFEKTGKFIGQDSGKQYDKTEAFDALYDFITDVNIDEKYKNTQSQLYRILNLTLEPMSDYARETDSNSLNSDALKKKLKDTHRQAIRKELVELPQEQRKFLLNSIATLASNKPIQNPNQQLA